VKPPAPTIAASHDAWPPRAFRSLKPWPAGTGPRPKRSIACKSSTSSNSASSPITPTSSCSGPTGVGKTHLACALGHAACLQRHSVLFASAIDIVNRLSAAQTAGHLAAELKRFETPRLLLIDELGYLPLDRRGGELLFQVISKRYERGSTIVTTNITFKEWPRYFGSDATMTSALLDRLLHHVEVVLIEGESYRGSKSA
jgi:DNA replication protein DnaC